MEHFLKNSTREYDWQASFNGIMRNLRENLLSASNATLRKGNLSKPLTTEAIYMICVLVTLILLSLGSSSITAFEYFVDQKESRASKRETVDGKHARRVSKEEKGNRGFEYFNTNGILKKTKSFLKYFCIFTNGSKNLTVTDSKDRELNCLHGLKVLLTVWAIFCHTSFYYSQSTRELLDRGELLMSKFMIAFLKADYLNDAFFTIGGFLNAHSFTRDYRKRGSISWFQFYIKRIIRIVPVYAILLGFYTTLFPYFGSGPNWPTYSTHPLCKNTWWWNLLFINNFQPDYEQCMVWTYFLANDFQFYVVSPLFLVTLCRWPKFGYFLTGICICGSCLINFFITKNYKLTVDLFRVGFHVSDMKGYFDGSFDNFNKLLDKPYARASSHLLGILLGYLLSSRKIGLTAKRNSVSLYLGWIMMAILVWICFATLNNARESLTNFAIFNGMRHVQFSVVISWLIFVCSTGHADFINRCLSWRGFIILSRLSYCAYLLNFFVLEFYFLRLRHTLEFSLLFMIVTSTCVFFWTYIASFLVSTLIEVPVSRLHSTLTCHQKKV